MFKEKIIKFTERGLLTFTFLLLIISFGRLVFIFLMREYIVVFDINDVLTAMYYGLRLSCQTAGILTAIILLCPRKLTAIIFLIMSIFYIASYPFYEQFHANFNQMIFNALNDDLYALFVTLLVGFHLLPRLLLALVITFILYKLFVKTLQINLIHSLPINLAAVYLLITLTFYGGGLSWQSELNFENIGVTNDKFLNEAILDPFQAVYRGYSLYNRIASSSGLNFTAEDVKKLAKLHAKTDIDSNDLDDYLKHKAAGAKIPKPKHIFIIISESYANWTLLNKYEDLHIADGVKAIINAPDTAYCPTFLPNGANTVSAVTGIVTGFADANLYLTTLPQSFDTVYSTSAAPQMKRLGYTANFYYAGSSTWERIGEFTVAQGFDNFYSQGDIKDAVGNVWGVDDKYLYEYIENKIDWTTPGFNVILNTSNHAPYTVDLEAEQIHLQKSFDDEELNKKLAHHAYSDRELKNFVDYVKSHSQDSLIVIVGDHADRCNIDKQPSDYERFAVPFIITGRGINHDIISKESAGSHIDVVSTVIELIAPADFEYYSIGTSLTENVLGVNYALFITRTAIGNANSFPLNPIPITESAKINLRRLALMTDYINYVRAISYWRIKYGKFLFDIDKLP